MDQPAGAHVRCSAVVFRGQEVLLVRRVREGGDEWVLPGGTPCPGESMAACARRETLEEAGLAVEPARIAFVLESHGPRSGLHTGAGIRIIFVTHLYDLAERCHAQNTGGALFLRAERRSDGRRTFRLLEGEPLPTSYGQDLYQQVFGTAYETAPA